MKKRFYLIAASFYFLSSAYAAPNLIDVYKDALANDQTFQSAKATYLAATEELPQAVALALPNVSLNANYLYNNTEVLQVSQFSSTGTGTFHYRSYQYTITANQPVIDFATWFGIHFAAYNVKEAAATYAAAAQDLISRTAEAYFNVLEAEDTLEFTRAEKRATARQLDQAEQRFKVGLDAITSVYDAQATYDAIVAEEIAGENDVVNAKEQLREITNKYYPEIAHLKRRMPLLTPDPEDVEVWVKKSDEYNFTLQAARFAVDAARENIKVQFSGHLPTVDAVGTYNRTKVGDVNTPFQQDTKTATLGFQLDLPIYQGGLINSQTRQAQYEYENAVAEMEGTHRQVNVDLRQTYNSIMSGISKIKADEQAIVSRQASVDSTEASLLVGTRTIVDLLIAQQALFEAQNTLAIDQYDYINNTLTFKELAGTLTVRDLYAINSWLEGSDGSLKSPYHVHLNEAVLKMHPNGSYHQKDLCYYHPFILGLRHVRPICNPKYRQKIWTSYQARIPSFNKGTYYYAIQLDARYHKTDIQKFINEHHLQSQTTIYSAKEVGKSWYLLLYGQYNTYSAAKRALQQLPHNLRYLNPWIRKVVVK